MGKGWSGRGGGREPSCLLIGPISIPMQEQKGGGMPAQSMLPDAPKAAPEVLAVGRIPLLKAVLPLPSFGGSWLSLEVFRICAQL